VKGLLASVIDEAEVAVENFGTSARVPTLVAQRLRSETYESPALPLSYSATQIVLRSTGAYRMNTLRGYRQSITEATRSAERSETVCPTLANSRLRSRSSQRRRLLTVRPPGAGIPR
jgi:hypothetical protein